MCNNLPKSLHFYYSADIDVIVNQIVFEEPLISESKKPHLRRLIYSKLQSTFIMPPPTKMMMMNDDDGYDECQYTNTGIECH